MSTTILFSPEPVVPLTRLLHQDTWKGRTIYTTSASLISLGNKIEEVDVEKLNIFKDCIILLNRMDQPVQPYFVINALLMESIKHNIHFVLCVDRGWYTSIGQRADFVVFDHVPEDWGERREVKERYFPCSDMDHVYNYFEAVHPKRAMMLNYMRLAGIIISMI